MPDGDGASGSSPARGVADRRGTALPSSRADSCCCRGTEFGGDRPPARPSTSLPWFGGGPQRCRRRQYGVSSWRRRLSGGVLAQPPSGEHRSMAMGSLPIPPSILNTIAVVDRQQKRHYLSLATGLNCAGMPLQCEKQTADSVHDEDPGCWFASSIETGVNDSEPAATTTTEQAEVNIYIRFLTISSILNSDRDGSIRSDRD